MIGITFALSFALLLMLQVMVMDLIESYRALRSEFEFLNDNQIYQDYEQN